MSAFIEGGARTTYTDLGKAFNGERISESRHDGVRRSTYTAAVMLMKIQLIKLDDLLDETISTCRTTKKREEEGKP